MLIDLFDSRLALLTALLLNHIHAVLQSLLVEAECLARQLKPDSDHVAHVHEAFVKVALLHLGSHHFDQATELIRQ